MPYTIDNPPAQIKNLPAHAQEIFIAAFNNAWKEHEDDEATCNAIAWAAVKKSYKQDEDGNWVKLADSLETLDIDDVEVLAVGTWRGTPETKTYTRKDLDEIVKSFKELTANKKLNYEPPIKLGHDPEQKLLQKDGYPAAGWISSLKRAGDKLVASIKGVPRKIGDIVKAGGYKKVSSEVYHEYEMGGKIYPLVLKAVSFLGGDIPAVKTLQDIVAQYGDSREEQLDIVIYEMGEKEAVSYDELATGLEEWLSKVEDKIRGRIGAPVFRTFASEVKARLKVMLAKETQHEESMDAKVEQIRQAFYSQTRPQGVNAADRGIWIKEVYEDSVIVNTPDGLYRVPYTANEEGVIAFDFDKQVKVEITYAPVPEADNETENKNKEEAMLKELKQLYGLPDDATEEQVLEAARGTKVKADSAHTSMAESEKVGDKVKELETKLAEKDRDEIVAKAINDGKLVPAQKGWAEEYALKDPEGFSAFVEAQPVVVNLGEKGTSGGEPVELTETEINIGGKMGVSQEDLIKAKKQG